MRLRTQLIVGLVGLIATLIIGLAGYFIRVSQAELAEANRAKISAMRDELRKKGEFLVRNVALASERAVAVRDFLFLTEVINSTTSNDQDIVYAIIMDRERRALVHSDTSKTGSLLQSPADLHAAAQDEVSSQNIEVNDQPVLEVSAPIRVGDERWGTIRFGLSLKTLNHEIEKTRDDAARRIKSSVLATVGGAVVLLFFASLIGAFAAARIARPLDALVASANRIREGDLESRAKPLGSPEFVGLANAFNDMSASLKKRDETLRDKNAELQQALEAATEASRLKSEFLANISHELRTPLNALINVPVSLLRNYGTFVVWHCPTCQTDYETKIENVGGEAGQAEVCPDDKTPMKLEKRVVCTGEAEEHQHFLRRMHQSGKHLLSVVNDLLDFSKLEAGKMKLFSAEIDVGQTLEEVRETMIGLSKEKNLVIHYPALAAPLGLVADSVKLVQIFINLIGNAIKFSPNGGNISVAADKRVVDGVSVIQFAVKDEGIGIPHEQVETVFESFRQVDGSHTRSHGGTGLGLAITRQLVQLHGGKIWCDSELGKGATFTFYLPVRGLGRLPQKSADLDNAGGAQRRVLVVDDNQIQLEITAMILEREGFSAELVADAEQAFDRAKALRPDLIVLDVMMPEVSGITILRQLAADNETKSIPVLVSTAYHSNREVVAEMGAIWLPKPWGSSELRQALHEHLGIELAPRSAVV